MKEIVKSKPSSVRGSMISVCNKLLGKLCTLKKVGYYSEALVAERNAQKKWTRDRKKFMRNNAASVKQWKDDVALHARHRDAIKLRHLQREQVCGYSDRQQERKLAFCRNEEKLQHVIVSIANPYAEFECL